MSTQLPLDLGLRRADRAEDFLPAPANAAAVAWIDRWPDWPGTALVLYGPAGSGKSHLAEIWRRRTAARRLGLAELGSSGPLALVESAPALVIDPVAGPVPERALLHVLNLAGEHRRPILLAAREPPARWAIGLPDLASRLAALPAVPIGAPDDALLRAVMAKLFHDRQVRIAPEVLDYLLPRMERSLAAAQSMVARLDARALTERSAVTVGLARGVLAELGEREE